MDIVAISWWLDWSALPDRLLWARLSVRPDGTAMVLDCDGVHHLFPSKGEAQVWLNEDEYSSLEFLIEEGDVAVGTCVPHASTERELVQAMSVVLAGSTGAAPGV